MKMTTDFSLPQYQSKKGILILAILSFGKILRNFWFIIIYLFYKNGVGSFPLISAVTISLLILVLFTAYFKYHYFTYHIDFENEEFIINKGIINKTTILLEKIKIQEVNINQPFFHRILDIYQLEIDSPGTDKKEITINAISNQDALFLKDYLLNKKEIAAEVSTSQIEEKLPLKISVLSVIKYAVTANYFKSFVALIGLLFYISQQILDTLSLNLHEYVQQKATEQNLELLSFVTVFIALFTLILIGILINVIRTVILYFNLKISKFKDYFSLEYGLFNTKNQIINKNKVQITTITQNYFQRLGDVLQIKFNQIGEENSKNNSSTIPGCNSAERNDLLKFVYSDIPSFNDSIQSDFRFLLSRSMIYILCPITVAFFLVDNVFQVLPFAFIYSIFAFVLIRFYFKNNRLSFGKNFLKKQQGIWDVEQKIFEIEKIQSVKISQYFWQKRTGLGTIYFSTAGGNIKLTTANINNLKKLMNFALYRVESSSKNWM